jgi:hypothetical protein
LRNREGCDVTARAGVYGDSYYGHVHVT